MFNRKVKQLEKRVEELEDLTKSLNNAIKYIEEDRNLQCKKEEMEELRLQIIEQYIKPQDLPLMIEIHYAGSSVDGKFWLKMGEIKGDRNALKWKETCQYKGIYEFMGYPWEIKDLVKKGYIERVIKSWQWDNRDKFKNPWIAVDCSKF